MNLRRLLMSIPWPETQARRSTIYGYQAEALAQKLYQRRARQP